MEENIVKKENVKKLFSWGGWKKELFWILFICALLFATWSYKRDMKICEGYLEDACKICAENIARENQLNHNQLIGDPLIIEDDNFPS